jgi:hypothetical protein
MSAKEGFGVMTNIVLTLAFLFLLGLTFAPQDPYVSAELEHAAIRIVLEELR